MQFKFITLALLIPFALSVATPVSPSIPNDAANELLPLEVRQDPSGSQPSNSPSPPPSSPLSSPPSSPPSGGSPDTSAAIASVVQAAWPLVDPIIQKGTIAVLSYLPTLLGSLYGGHAKRDIDALIEKRAGEASFNGDEIWGAGAVETE